MKTSIGFNSDSRKHSNVSHSSIRSNQVNFTIDKMRDAINDYLNTKKGTSN